MNNQEPMADVDQYCIPRFDEIMVPIWIQKKLSIDRLNELGLNAHQNSDQETTVAADVDDNYIPRLDCITDPIQMPKRNTNQHKFTATQLLALKKEFVVESYPSKERKLDLLQEIGLTERQIKSWYSNRRAAQKKSKYKKNRLTKTSICESESTNSSNNDGECNESANDHNCRANGIGNNSENSFGPVFNFNFEEDFDNSFNKFFDTYLGNFNSSFDITFNSDNDQYPALNTSNNLDYYTQSEQSTIKNT